MAIDFERQNAPKIEFMKKIRQFNCDSVWKITDLLRKFAF